MNCNRCGSPMIPTDTALVPAMACTNEGCGRLVPRTGVRHPKMTRAGENRVMRAARRRRTA